MLGMRVLSVFLKVNPYFTFAMAAGFSGIVAIGVKHSDTTALQHLIPLHLRTIVSDSPPYQIVTVVPGIETARQFLQALSLLPVGSSASVYEHFEHPVQSVSLTVREPLRREDPSSAIFGDPAAPGDFVRSSPADLPTKQSVLKAEEPFINPDPPLRSWDRPPPTQPRQPEVPLVNRSGPVLAPVLAMVMPLAPSPSIEPFTEIAPLMAFPLELSDLVILPVPAIFPEPDHAVAEVAEPPMGLLFAGLLSVLVGLRRRALRSGSILRAS